MKKSLLFLLLTIIVFIAHGQGILKVQMISNDKRSNNDVQSAILNTNVTGIDVKQNAVVPTPIDPAIIKLKDSLYKENTYNLALKAAIKEVKEGHYLDKKTGKIDTNKYNKALNEATIKKQDGIIKTDEANNKTDTNAVTKADTSSKAGGVTKSDSLRAYFKKTYDRARAEAMEDIKQKDYADNKEIPQIDTDNYNKALNKAIVKYQDKIVQADKRAAIDKIDSADAVAKVDTLNNTIKASFLASGGISDVTAQNPYGNLSVGFQLRISDFNHIDAGLFRNWINAHYAYCLFSTKTASTSDSSLQKTFLFPEFSKRDFVLGYDWQLQKGNFSIQPTIELSLNKYNDTAQLHTFHSESLLVGIKFAQRFSVPAVNLSGALQFLPYYNIITVDPKDFYNYQQVIGENSTVTDSATNTVTTTRFNPHPTYHIMGLQTILQVQNFSIFCDMRYVLNKMNNSDVTMTTTNGVATSSIPYPDFVRFVYTIGTSITF